MVAHFDDCVASESTDDEVKGGGGGVRPKILKVSVVYLFYSPIFLVSEMLSYSSQIAPVQKLCPNRNVGFGHFWSFSHTYYIKARLL